MNDKFIRIMIITLVIWLILLTRTDLSKPVDITTDYNYNKELDNRLIVLNLELESELELLKGDNMREIIKSSNCDSDYIRNFVK